MYKQTDFPVNSVINKLLLQPFYIPISSSSAQAVLLHEPIEVAHATEPPRTAIIICSRLSALNVFIGKNRLVYVQQC